MGNGRSAVRSLVVDFRGLLFTLNSFPPRNYRRVQKRKNCIGKPSHMIPLLSSSPRILFLFVRPVSPEM